MNWFRVLSEQSKLFVLLSSLQKGQQALYRSIEFIYLKKLSTLWLLIKIDLMDSLFSILQLTSEQIVAISALLKFRLQLVLIKLKTTYPKIKPVDLAIFSVNNSPELLKLIRHLLIVTIRP